MELRRTFSEGAYVQPTAAARCLLSMACRMLPADHCALPLTFPTAPWVQSQFTFPVGSYQPNTRYTFYAYARNPVGDGPPSDPVSLRAPPR